MYKQLFTELPALPQSSEQDQTILQLTTTTDANDHYLMLKVHSFLTC